LAKHEILRAYLEKYVSVLTARPSQEQLKLTLVDGFAGGGVYLHPDKQELICGSPFIMLEAMRAAQAAAQTARNKPFHLNVEYFFIEKDPKTVQYLRDELDRADNARAQRDNIQVLEGCFCCHLEYILERIEQRGRSRRVIFVLDQYGYSDVRMSDLQRIFRRLPNAEVILTIAIDWLLDFCVDTTQFNQTLKDLGIESTASALVATKRENPADWRPVIQHTLHHELYEKSGATYYTPFFIFSSEAHRAYWLIHFSGHSKARDVMMQLHWELSNHFQHFGEPGFCMLGHDPSKDLTRLGYRRLPFDFDSLAEEETHYALREQIPSRIAVSKDGIKLGDFFNSVLNETPATKKMIADGIRELTLEKELEVRTPDGKMRRNGVQLRDDDIILRPRQRRLLGPR